MMAEPDNDTDIPEVTDTEFARMRPAAEVHPEIVERYRGQRGPQKTPTKKQVTLRLDADLVEALRAGGKGWQTRVNALLRRDILNEAADDPSA